MVRGAFAAVLLAVASTFPMNAFAQIAAGQVWTFKDAPADTARVAIYKIETLGSKEAVHVSVYNLPREGVFTGEISHMPFERQALEASLDRLTNDTAPSFKNAEEGYRTWQNANGGIFTLSLAQAVAYVVEMTTQATPFADRHKQ